MPAMAASVTSNAAIAELHQSLRFMLKRWRESRQASEHDVKPSLDPIRGYLAKVDSKLSEMMLWDEILLEITRRPGLCCGHGALITLLKALRSQITDLTSAVALLTSEAKKRAAYDWTVRVYHPRVSISLQKTHSLTNCQRENLAFSDKHLKL
ncbi:hypothetical protein BVRB_025080 [Beta vulgaris subsp. vulgaris]|uniref:Uncharacterized protein n=1 Tax=Beta vulgaris subsp. vulgaris TaxID=3555 RepID=A0A0J8B2J8_BETVV|nr:hypothetical protein BVRB_025080 [Beta vulgaris subsp. vulgaris]